MKILFVGDFFCDGNDSFDWSQFGDLAGENIIVIVNFEGCFPHSGLSSKSVNLGMSVSVLNKLPDNVYLNLINNHSLDFGVSDYQKMKQKIFETNYLNAIEDRNEIIIDGQRVIFMGDRREQVDCAGLACHAFDESVIRTLKVSISGAIVVVHGGLEYRKYPTPYQRHLSHLLVNLGAETVIFVHSHIEGHVEYYREKFIHYGLGNFYFSLVNSLHGPENNSSFGLLFDIETSKVKEFMFLDNGVHEIRDFAITEFCAPENYPIFYKGMYPLNPSLRPRQLSYRQSFVNIQFFLWNIFASQLVKYKLSVRLKQFISRFGI